MAKARKASAKAPKKAARSPKKVERASKKEPPPGRASAEIQAANPPEPTAEQKETTMFPKKF